MIVGRGIVATSMQGSMTDATIFASGVSNSACTDPLDFLREKELILSQRRDRKFVYFSTCSLSDNSAMNEYLRHKLHMERIISENFDDWNVLRLPTVVGLGGNSTNFFNHISKRLREGSTVTAHMPLLRHLLDADHILPLVSSVIDKTNNEVVNVCVDNPESVLEIILSMKKEIGSESEIVTVDVNANRRVDNCRIKEILGHRFEDIDRADYNRRLIKKYLSI